LTVYSEALAEGFGVYCYTTTGEPTMHNHQYTYKPSAEHVSKAQEIIIIIACLAVFALWGVLLALGV
jgi:hypothetical protein